MGNHKKCLDDANGFHAIYALSRNNNRILNVYCEIFGTSSYKEGRTSMHLRRTTAEYFTIYIK